MLNGFGVCVGYIIYTDMHVTKKAMNLKYSKDRIYGRIWREEREGVNDIIIL